MDKAIDDLPVGRGLSTLLGSYDRTPMLEVVWVTTRRGSKIAEPTSHQDKYVVIVVVVVVNL
jgi:hypothetical protein